MAGNNRYKEFESGTSASQISQGSQLHKLKRADLPRGTNYCKSLVLTKEKKKERKGKKITKVHNTSNYSCRTK